MTDAASPILELRDITAGYGDKTVLRNVSLSVPRGSAVAILGPNGAGKTTLLRVASGGIRPTRGRVEVGGADVTERGAHARVKAGLCHIPDPRGIFPSMTVRENLILQGGRGRGERAIQQAAEVFPRLGERLSQRAGSLSGGEQQMLAVSRAYVQNPDVVLLDEVSMGLAPTIVDEIFVFLEGLLARGVALVIVEQFVHRALAIADTVAVLVRGEMALSGRAGDFTEDAIFDAYAGITAAPQGAS